jgi:hypothetical protein
MNQTFSPGKSLQLNLVFSIGLLILSVSSKAANSDWNQYENGHFLVYSNAREKVVLELLRELEEFRAAFLQVSVITVPEDAPKTRVLILRNQREFSRLKPFDYTAAFAQHIDGHTVIVMPAQGSSMDSGQRSRLPEAGDAGRHPLPFDHGEM